MAKVNKLETPLLRVSRPVSACQRCRNAKVKCDGKLPACTACERAGRSEECSSANDQFARGKERSYVASLENRVDKLERQIAQAKARQETTNALDIVSAQPLLAPPVLAAGHSANGDSRNRRKEIQDVNDLVSDFGFLSVNATARDFHGFTKQMSFARLVLSTSSKEEMPRFTVNVLPQRHVATSLITHYLESMHSLYPFLSETRLFAAIDAVYQHDSRKASSTDHWLTRMVLAIAHASKSRRRGDTQYQDAVRHAAGALEHIESVVHPGSVGGVQAMLLLVIYAMLDPHHFSSWYLIGLASRAMVDIGMHQDPPKESRMKEVGHEMARRVYMSIYALDRSISMVYRRGFSFTDDSTGVDASLLPTQRDVPSNGKPLFGHSLEAAVQLNHLRQIQSYAYQKLFQSERLSFADAWPLISSALYDMRRWSEALPAIPSDHGLKPFKRLFRSDVLYSSILILSSDLSGTLCDYGRFLIFEYAVEYADLMMSFTSDQEQPHFHTYHDALTAAFVAERLIRTLYTDTAILFNDQIPQAPSHSIPPSGPFAIPVRTVGERVNRAQAFLTQMEQILGHLGPRYGYLEPLNEFKARSSGLRYSLQATFDNWNRSLGISQSQYVFAGASVSGLPRQDY